MQPTSHAAMSGVFAVQTGKRRMARAGAQRLHGRRFPPLGLVLTAKGPQARNKKGGQEAAAYESAGMLPAPSIFTRVIVTGWRRRAARLRALCA